MRDDLERELQRGGLLAAPGTRVVGHPVHYVRSTGSTNDDLKELARAGAPEGLVLTTDEQTRGRGRRGRTWSAPAGSSLLASTLLRPVWLPPADGFYLTIMAAVAAAEAVEEIASVPVELKWPNDLEIGGLKLGGILVETEITGGAIQWAVAGIGLNANWDPASIPELATTATTLASATGRPISRAELLLALLRRLDDHYLRLRAGAREALFDAWRRRLTTIGRVVRAETPGGALEGVAEDVTLTGALVVRDSAGTRHEFTAGDVTVRSQELAP